MNLATALKLLIAFAPLIPELMSDATAVETAVKAKGGDLEAEIKAGIQALIKLMSDISGAL